MRRLYFLVPSVASAGTLVSELRNVGLLERHLHVLAAHGAKLAPLPEASLLERTDFLRGLELGVAAGGITGLLAGLIAVSLPAAGVVLGGSAVLYSGLAGAGLGAWIAGLVGLDFPDQRLLSFERAISAGAILLLVDVSDARIQEIEDLVLRHHPEADFGGCTPTLPPIVAE